MTIPTRWHKPSCDTPHVVVDGNVPECRACGSSAFALLQKAAEEPAPSYSGIKLPPEAPIGQMNLWWPPCVSYTRDGASRTQPGASSVDAASLAPQALDSSLSEIYTSTLGKDYFRLLYLSGACDIHSPVHGDLVEYERDNCPEYETASYTWGGEDGDATPCRPAYFGNFWDVLFLTRNCWSLLQYLRPQMGTRAVWVDAICINQNNISERGAQVSIMTQIYKNCLRVVIYPGGHLVRKDEHRFRERIKHDDIIERDGLYYVNGSGSDIWHSVFQSRYIGRVWVIQELILAPAAILALDNHDLYLDNNLLHRVSGKESGRDWLEFMGQGYKLCQTTLYEGLKMTFDSQATDPRDKIFGILGILGPNPTYSEIVPEYSLSMRDCVIGAIGLTLLISNEFWPLQSVQNSSTISRHPSWLPSLDEIVSWTDEPLRIPVAARSINSKMRGDWPTFIKIGEYNPTLTFPNHDEFRCYPHIGSWDGSDPEGKIEAAVLTQRHILLVGPEISWHQDASIGSGTGALTLRLVRLFDTPHQLVEGPPIREAVKDLGGFTLWDVEESYYHVQGPSSEACFVTTRKPPKLERPCHLFLAFRVESPRTQENPDPNLLNLGNSEIYLLFAEEFEASGTFKLLACRRLDAAMFCSATRMLPQCPYLLSEPVVHNVLSLFDVLHKSLNYKPSEHLKTSRESEAKLFDLIVPGQETITPEYLQLVLAVARTVEPAGVTEEFRRAYTTSLQSRSGGFNPVLDHESVWFTLDENDALGHFEDSLFRHGTGQRGEFFPSWLELQIPEIKNTDDDYGGCVGVPSWPKPQRCGHHKDCENQGRMTFKHWLPCAPEPKQLQFPVKAKMPLKDILKGIRETRLHWLLRYLLAFGEKVCEDAETLLERGPQPQDSNIYLQEWPQSLVDELDFVWRSEMVTFV